MDLVSYGRRGPGQTDRLSPAQIEQIARTVRRVPEVMVKVSGGGSSPKAVAAHFKYIDRHGKLEIETDDGEQLRGKGVENDLVEDWDLDTDTAESRSPYIGTPGRKPSKLVHNIVLSMPAGTPPDRLLAASRALAREQFALKHRYGMVLHTDQDHPHVHLVVKAMSEHGERLNIRKATLREWRQEFARHLRDQGIAANATDRTIRGETKPRKLDSIHRAMLRGESTHMRERVESMATTLRKEDISIDRGKVELLEMRKDIERGWRAVSRTLASGGQLDLAKQVVRFVEQMPPPRSENEWLAAGLLEHTRGPRVRDRPVPR